MFFKPVVDIKQLKELQGVPDARVLGPAPLPIARVNRTWRYRVTVSCPEGRAVRTE